VRKALGEDRNSFYKLVYGETVGVWIDRASMYGSHRVFFSRRFWI